MNRKFSSNQSGTAIGRWNQAGVAGLPSSDFGCCLSRLERCPLNISKRDLWFPLIVLIGGCATLPEPIVERSVMESDDEIVRAIYANDVKHINDWLRSSSNNVNEAFSDHTFGYSFPLRTAASLGRVDVCRILIDYGAYLDPPPPSDKTVQLLARSAKTPLLAACFNHHAEVVSLLVKAGANVDAQDELGFSCLMWASSSFPPSGMLAEAGVGSQNTEATPREALEARYRAAKDRRNAERTVRALLKGGPNICLTNFAGETVFDMQPWNRRIHKIIVREALSHKGNRIDRSRTNCFPKDS
jgi:hypothetical protein